MPALPLVPALDDRARPRAARSRGSRACMWLSGSSSIACVEVRRSPRRSGRPACSTTPRLLCAAAIRPTARARARGISIASVEVAEQALVVAEQRPEVDVGVPAELDAAAQRRVGAVQAAEVVQHLAEHAVVRSVLGREQRPRGAARPRLRRSARGPSAPGRGCATPATRAARRRRACAAAPPPTA